jgi:adenine-specific DNA-methyltransferase
MVTVSKFREKFYNLLGSMFVGDTKIEGQGGFINLLKIKGKYYENEFKPKLQEKVEKVLSIYPNFEAELFEKLYTFFSRYFSESGSIYFVNTSFYHQIYERIYSDNKDVVLFWKTRDLYYIKTDRIFKSLEVKIVERDKEYSFYFDVSKLEYKKANEKREVIFELDEEKTTKEKIYFYVYYSEKGRTTKIEDILKSLKKKDIKITEDSLEKAFRRFEQQSEVDYFIHKNAKAFLTEQLKLYIYNYLFKEKQDWTKERLDQIYKFQEIAELIIDFVSKFEDELVKIWNKPRFVFNSNYVITLDKIVKQNKEKGFEIIEKIINHKNFDEQVKEWKELRIIDEKFSKNEIIQTLLTGKELNKKYQFLPIDTKYFKDLEIEILSLFDDLDNQLDGWLIKSENYQALNTILPKFKEKIQTIYIDPPYNTGSDGFIYKDRYQHSSWLTMMENRLSLAKELMREDGVIFVSIDDNEVKNLSILMNEIFGMINYLNTFCWVNNLKGRQILKNGAAKTYEHVLTYGKNINNTKVFEIPIKTAQILIPSSYKGFDYEIETDEQGKFVIKNELYNTNSYFNEETRPNLVFNIHYNFETQEIRFSEIDEDIDYAGFVKIPPKKNNDGIHKFHAWRWSKEEIIRRKSDLKFVKTKDGVKIFTKVREFDKTMLKDIISDIPTTQGTNEIRNLFGNKIFSSYPKPTYLIKILLYQSKEDSIILDFFAGSGTTAHAVMKLNKGDVRKRKFILVEMADYFYDIIIPRIKKVAYSFNWKDGKPQDNDGIGIFIKYYELEQYEEILRKAKYLEPKEQKNLFAKDFNYIFYTDPKMLDAIELDYENNKIKADLTKIYSEKDIDIAETLSNLKGKWIKRINENEVEFKDGEKINTKNLDYKLIKNLIYWA